MRSGEIAARVLALAVVVVLAVPAFAQGLDPGSLQALTATLRMLGNPAERGAAIGDNAQATGIDEQIRAMAGKNPKAVDEFYALASQVFEDLERSTGGDAKKMSETLARAQTDPASFAAMLSPATREKLRALAAELSSAKP